MKVIGYYLGVFVFKSAFDLLYERVKKVSYECNEKGDHGEVSYFVQEYIRACEVIEDPALFINFIVERNYFNDPASIKYHGAWSGGLMCHSVRVLYHALRLSLVICDLENVNCDSLVLSCSFHDISKMGSYKVVKRNTKDEVTGEWIQVNKYDKLTNKNPLYRYMID